MAESNTIVTAYTMYCFSGIINLNPVTHNPEF